MKSLVKALVATALCCWSCVEINYGLGANMVSDSDRISVCADTVHIKDISCRRADSLSGYSTRKIAIGSIRDNVFGLSERGAAFSLVPLNDTLDFGTSPVVRRFHFSARADSISVCDLSQANILQNVFVYELERPLNPLEDYDCNAPVAHGWDLITQGVPVINGRDSLSFDFTGEFGQKFLDLAKDGPYVVNRMEDYLEKIPGIYIGTASPAGYGGRFNFFELQLGFDANEMRLTGNLASLTVRTDYPGRKGVDTTFFFYFGADKFYNVDSLLTKGSRGNYPQYCLNHTSGEGAVQEYESGDRLYVEGGGGLKPVIGGRDLREKVRRRIIRTLNEKNLDSTRIGGVVINKATLVMPFDYPGNDRIMYRFPVILSPTLRSYVTKIATLPSGEEKTYKVRAYANITDSSSSTEDKGDINRSPLRFAGTMSSGVDSVVMSYKPDITFYMQNLVNLPADDPDLLKGEYDIWLMIQAYETITTGASVSASVEEMNEYYQYLAYQNYYNNMYNGGYGDYYSNYYSYMLAAQYASGSGTTTSVQVQIDKDRYYRAVLRGRGHRDAFVPTLEIIYSVPQQ